MSFINSLLKTVEGQLLQAIGKHGTKAADVETFKPGDVSLVDISLQSRTRDRLFPLFDHVKFIDVYESILTPVMFCDLSVFDAIGLRQSFPILGGEFITLSFKTPGNKKETTYSFLVQSISNVTTTPNNKGSSYIIKCVSTEILRNSDRHIDRVTDGTISDAIKDVLKDDLGTNKRVNIEKTQGIEKHVLTHMHPFVAVDFLRQRATSTKYPSSSFVFFENKDGFHLKTVEGMIEDGRKGVEQSSKKFFFDTMRNESVENINFRDIVSYNHVVFNDIVTQTQQGGFNNNIKGFNLITGSYTEVKYNDSKGADQFQLSDKSGSINRNTSDIKELSKNSPVSKIVPINTDISNDRILEKYVNSRAFAQKISQNILQIQVYGDNTITVGDVIECTLPSATGMTEDQGGSRLDSGNYLVSKVRHTIINSDRPQHTMALELIKSGITK